MLDLPSADSADPVAWSERVARRLALGLAAAVALTTLVTLAGYLTGSLELVRSRPDWQTMSTSTALLCLGLSVALAADAVRQDLWARASGALVLVLSAALLIGQWTLGRDPLSPLLLGLIGGSPLSAETSMATAGCAGLLAIGALCRPRAQPAAALAVLVMLVTGLAVLCYAYGVRDLYALVPFRTISLRTGLALFGLAAGFLITDRQGGVAALVLDQSPTGGATRRQLAFLVVPPVAAYLLLRATSTDKLGAAAAIACLVVVTVAPLAMLILRDAKSLMQLDRERQEKSRIEKAKLTAEQRYRSLFNSLETGFCVIELAFDPLGKPTDYRYLEINPAFASETGLVDAQGKWMRELAPDHDQHWVDVYGAVAQTGQAARFEHEATALGRYYDVYAFRVDEAEARHVAILFSDISDRRRSEIELKALNDTLEIRVAERAAELEFAQEALRQSQKMEAIGQLTGGVAHDFNNLLTVIRGSVDLLSRPNLTDERRLRYTRTIGETADRAAKLTNQLLAFARLQALQPEVFDVGASLREILNIVASLTGARIDVSLKIPEEPCFVLADRSQFDTAVVNMAVNARDAMNGEGRIVMTCATVSSIPALRAHPAVPGEFVAVTVIDSGMGIEPSRLVQIFEPFFTTKAVGVGTGLGLSQVIGFAKQSGGDVLVDSVVGEGATFTLYLPREHVPVHTAEPKPPAPEIRGEGLRVLVVEDNAQVGEFASESLRELEYESVLAADAEKALGLLAENSGRFDIVFSDVILPGMSGLELGAEIRRLYPKLPIVLASGYSHVLAQTGSDGFELLHKPYSIGQLSDVLRRTIGPVDSRQPPTGHRLDAGIGS